MKIVVLFVALIISGPAFAAACQYGCIYPQIVEKPSEPKKAKKHDHRFHPAHASLSQHMQVCGLRELHADLPGLRYHLNNKGRI